MTEQTDLAVKNIIVKHGERLGDIITIDVMKELDGLVRAIDDYYESISEQE
jgi:hypothetical protein